MDNVAVHLQRLQLGRRRRRPRASQTSPSDPHAAMRRLLVGGFRSDDPATFRRQHAASGAVTPVFQVAFARAVGGLQQSHRAARLLAAVDEDGVVSLIDSQTTAGATTPPGAFQHVHHKWQAHENAIFDVAWARDNAFLLTASGDLRATAWDVETQQSRFSLRGGHTMSVKCVRPSDDHGDVIATGARDGHVLIWDARSPAKPVAQLRGVHSVASPPVSGQSSPASNVHFVSPTGARKRRKTAATSSSPRSVTSVEFMGGGNEIATAGAVDGVVKIWDLRRLTAQRKIALSSTINSAATPLRSFSCGSVGGVGARTQRGITSLALDPVNRTRLLVSVLHDELCVLDVHARETPIVQRYEGHVASSFYVKAAFSPDGDFVVSGSGDGAVYLWEATSRSPTARAPLLALAGHDAEVNGVAWHASDFSKLATCSDDGTIRVWTADRHAKREPFVLRRKQRQWQNWCELEGQPRGRAFAVGSLDDDDEEQVKTTPEKEAVQLSPPVVRRNADALAPRPQPPEPSSSSTPSRKRPQTLLDFWGR